MIFGMQEQLLPRFLNITTKFEVLIYNAPVFKVYRNQILFFKKSSVRTDSRFN